MIFMSTQKELIENICTQIKECLMMMKSLSFGKKDCLLKLETQHLDLLLELLLSKIDIKSYINQYNSLYPNNWWCEYTDIYKPQILFLEKQQIDIVSIDSDVVCFIDVLQICNNNIKKRIDCEYMKCKKNITKECGRYEKAECRNHKKKFEKYKEIEEEIYYNHNIPSFILSKDIERINLYLNTRKSFRNFFPKHVVKPYEKAWKQIIQHFLP